METRLKFAETRQAIWSAFGKPSRSRHVQLLLQVPCEHPTTSTSYTANLNNHMLHAWKRPIYIYRIR